MLVVFSFGIVTTIDTVSNTPRTTIPVGLRPGMISISPNGSTAYVANSLSDTVSIIDVLTETVVGNIILPTGAGPYGSSILPSGKVIYIANSFNDTVSVFNIPLTATGTATLVTTIAFPAGSGPFWAAATPDGKTVHVINLHVNSNIPIDVATNTLRPPILLTGLPQIVEVTSDPAPLASFVAHRRKEKCCKEKSHLHQKVTIRFDVSSSTSPIGTIVNYTWNFGDGTVVTALSPIIEHTYLLPEKCKMLEDIMVTLKVTNSAGTSTEKVWSSRFMSNNGGPTATTSRILRFP